MRVNVVLGALLGAALFANPALADKSKRRIEERRPLDADGRLVVENVSGSIRITGTDEEVMSMVAMVGEDVERVEVSGEGERVRIEVETERGNYASADLEIRVPRSARIEVTAVSADVVIKDATGTAEVATVSGNIDLGGELKTIEIKSVSGDLDVQAASERLEAKTVSGDIVAAYASGEVELETVSGDLKISAGTITRFRAKSVSGDIRLHGEIKGSGSSRIESHSGDVTLELGSGTDARFDVRSFSGRVRGAMDGGEHDGRTSTFRVGSGSARVEIQTFSGDVEVKTK